MPKSADSGQTRQLENYVTQIVAGNAAHRALVDIQSPLYYGRTTRVILYLPAPSAFADAGLAVHDSWCQHQEGHRRAPYKQPGHRDVVLCDTTLPEASLELPTAPT